MIYIEIPPLATCSRPHSAEDRVVPFNLTIGWVQLKDKTYFKHDETLIARFLELKEKAWRSEGLPFHLWLTSPALEILDVTFAMNTGWAKSRDDCARLIIYKPLDDANPEPSYHPTLVGEAFFERIGAVL